MKIIHFVQSLDMGGIENLIFNLSLKFDKEGHEVHVIAFQRGGRLAERMSEKGLKVTILNISSMKLSSVSKVRRIFKEENPDIIHYHSYPSATLGRTALLFNRIPHFYHLHTQISKAHDFSRGMRFREKILNLSRTNFIAVSDYVKRDYQKLFNTADKNFSVLSGGVYDIEPIDKLEARKLLGLEKNNIYLSIVASLTAHKNHKYLIDIIKELKSVELLIAGDGPLRRDLEKYTADIGISDRIHFLGIREDINTIYSASDAAILTSNREGLGLSLIEAQRSALPCFGTAVGGIPEVIKDGENGYIIPEDNPVESAAIIKELLSDKETLKKFGSESRKRFETEFVIEHYFNKLLALYERHL